MITKEISVKYHMRCIEEEWTTIGRVNLEVYYLNTTFILEFIPSS